MPALPNASQIIRCVYNGTYGGAKWANVFHVRYTSGTPTQADMNALAFDLGTTWNARLAALHLNTVSLSGTTTTDLTSNTGLVGSDATTHPGTVAATSPLPANVALVGSFKIPRRYRGGHPRMYLCGQSGANTTNANNWTSTWITTSTTAWGNWLADINALTFTSMPGIQLVNLSYYSAKVLRPMPVYDVIGAIVVHNRIDTMRRRLGKEIA